MLSVAMCHSVRLTIVGIRDVTKFEFEFDNVAFSTDSKFDECFVRFVVECEFVEKKFFFMTDFICTESQRERRQTFFSQIQPVTKTTVIECAI